MAVAGFLLALSPVGSAHQRVLTRSRTTLAKGGPVNPYTLGIGAETIVLMVVQHPGQLARADTCCRKWRCCWC